MSNPAAPDLQPGLVEELTAAYASLLRQQRTASAAYVRWVNAHSRAHEFAWLEPGKETLFSSGEGVVFLPSSVIYSAVQKMMSTIELNPYERELRYGYPYVVGQVNGKAIRAPLLSIAIAITTDRDRLILKTTEDTVRFNSLPFRTENDTAAREQSLTRLIDETPNLPLTNDSIRAFCSSATRELGLNLEARLDGLLDKPPAYPNAAQSLKIIDNAACFIAPKSSYFLVSDLERIGEAPAAVAGTALGWLLGKRPSEPTSDRFDDRGKLYFPFPSNPSQRRVAHLMDDPQTRIAVVQGPPGTGKSLTIANLVCHLVASGKRVLVSSQKDKALDVVDALLRELALEQLPMTLLRQDRESKQELRERLESIQKDRSSRETEANLDREVKAYTEVAAIHSNFMTHLRQSLLAEHNVENAVVALKKTRSGFSRLRAKWRLRKTLRRAEKSASARSDSIGDSLTKARESLKSQAITLLHKAAEHRTSSASKTERNQLREFAKLVGRNQTNYKNYPVFDRLKADPERCNMLLKILPCWIMAPDDVARLFPCIPALFDVAIIDEASQCDLPSMTPVLFRAKQTVIAGDSKQMQSQRFAFTSTQVAAQAWAERGLDQLDPDRWLDPSKIDLLQLASVRMDEEVFLDEHYRCLPGIIGFSNKKWYRDRLRIMRDSLDKRVGDSDGPSVSLHRVVGRVKQESQENEIEARELIGKLHEMLIHPAYSEASFGVICLFQEQMRLVSDLVAELIPEEIRNSHDLVVVNPDGFQGDERDVILYSLSYDGDGMTQAALSARQADREHIQGMLNVAFTRAKDEIHIFYSAEIDAFSMTSGSGAIKEWLEFCSQQCRTRSQPSKIDTQIAKAQSEFEAEVLSELSSRGVTVRSQYATCGYFIDCVAELDNARLALECDGEIWHLDEHGNLRAEDIARQEVLERAGWNVLRIPYRSWREDKDGQIKRVLDALNGDRQGEYQSNNDPAPNNAPRIFEVDKYESAVISALHGGNCSKDQVLRSAREALGFSRLGPQLRVSIIAALERLQRRQIVSAEDDEIFFASEESRLAEYPLGSPARSTYSRSSSRYRRRGYRH